jgi:hypothetical protein
MGSHQRQHQLNGVGDLQAYDMNPISSCLHRGYLVIRRIGYLPTFKSGFHGYSKCFVIRLLWFSSIHLPTSTHFHPLTNKTMIVSCETAIQVRNYKVTHRRLRWPVRLRMR